MADDLAIPPVEEELLRTLVIEGKYWGKSGAVALVKKRYQKLPEHRLIEWALTLYNAVTQAALDRQFINVMRGFFELSSLVRPLIARGVRSWSGEEILVITQALWLWARLGRRVPFCNVDAAYWATEMLASKDPGVLLITSSAEKAALLLIRARWHIHADDGDKTRVQNFLLLARDELKYITDPNKNAVVLRDLALLYWDIGEQKVARSYAAQLCNLDGVDPGIERRGVAYVRHMFFG